MIMLRAIKEFLRLESAGGIVLFFAAVLAMVAENTPFKPVYDALLSIPLSMSIGPYGITKPLLLWINEGLMAVFFFLVGMEIKREVMQGTLSDPARLALPVLAAVGGMAVPALVYVAFNFRNSAAMTGWAVPTATDIAFALGVLALLGRRIPHALRMFLLTLAIVDDMGAVIIIAVFYTADLATAALAIAAAALAVLYLCNRFGVMKPGPYLILGVVLWLAVLKSGVHATLAGLLLAFFIPLAKGGTAGSSPLQRMETRLHPFVAYAVLPLFAFANAGVSLQKFSLSTLTDPISLGILAGLFFGKQVGVFGFSWLGIRTGLCRMPPHVTWIGLYGAALLCGIGFTMSLFIASLAFEHGASAFAVDERAAILLGSTLSACAGYLWLRFTLQPPPNPVDKRSSGTEAGD
jgi:Na+/H+ antiporter NhaA